MIAKFFLQANLKTDSKNLTGITKLIILAILLLSLPRSLRSAAKELFE